MKTILFDPVFKTNIIQSEKRNLFLSILGIWLACLLCGLGIAIYYYEQEVITINYLSLSDSEHDSCQQLLNDFNETFACDTRGCCNPSCGYMPNNYAFTYNYINRLRKGNNNLTICNTDLVEQATPFAISTLHLVDSPSDPNLSQVPFFNNQRVWYVNSYVRNFSVSNATFGVPVWKTQSFRNQTNLAFANDESLTFLYFDKSNGFTFDFQTWTTDSGFSVWGTLGNATIADLICNKQIGCLDVYSAEGWGSGEQSWRYKECYNVPDWEGKSTGLYELTVTIVDPQSGATQQLFYYRTFYNTALIGWFQYQNALNNLTDEMCELMYADSNPSNHPVCYNVSLPLTQQIYQDIYNCTKREHLKDYQIFANVGGLLVYVNTATILVLAILKFFFKIHDKDDEIEMIVLDTRLSEFRNKE